MTIYSELDAGMTGRLVVRIWASELKIEGRSSDLVELAQAIERRNFDVRLAVAEAEDSECPLNSIIRLVVEESTGKVMVALRGNALAIRGSSMYLRMLAEEIDRFARGDIPGGANHIHIETYPGHFFLDHDSVPLLIERKEE